MEINAAEFRANCFKILDQVKITHKEVIITKRGKPVARLVHFARQNEKESSPWKHGRACRNYRRSNQTGHWS